MSNVFSFDSTKDDLDSMIIDIRSSLDSLYVESSNTPIANEPPNEPPTLLEMAEANENVQRSYAVLGDLQGQIDYKTDILEKIQRELIADRTNAELELNIEHIELEINRLIKHRIALCCCNGWGSHHINENRADLQYRVPKDCRRSYCPRCGSAGSKTNVIRAQSGFKIVDVCENSNIAIGSDVFTTAPEIRKGLLDENKISKLQKGAVELVKKYFGVAGVQAYPHVFGNNDENGFAVFAPHFNLVYPFADKDGNEIKTYKLSVEQLRQMRIEWGLLQEKVSGLKLGKATTQNKRELELIIEHQFFIYDGKEWWGKDNRNGHIVVRDVKNHILYETRSTIHPDNLVKQPQNVKDFVYHGLHGFHFSRGYGKLYNGSRTKYLTLLDESYESPAKAKKPYRCLIDGSELKTKKLLGSNKAYISNIYQDSTIASVEENVVGISTSLHANYNVVYGLLWKSIWKVVKSASKLWITMDTVMKESKKMSSFAKIEVTATRVKDNTIENFFKDTG